MFDHFFNDVYSTFYNIDVIQHFLWSYQILEVPITKFFQILDLNRMPDLEKKFNEIQEMTNYKYWVD